MKNQKGFTKIEIVIILVLLLILGAIIWIAVDPFTRVAQDRDNIRRSEVVAILNGVLKYKTMNDQQFPEGIDSNPETIQVLGSGTSGCDLTCGAARAEIECLNLDPDLVDKYLEEIPMDPSSGTPTNTDYYVNVNTSGKLFVGACDPELAETITVSR